MHLIPSLAALLALDEGAFRTQPLADALAHAGDKDVLVFVHAEWCGPCNTLSGEVLEADAGRKLASEAVAIEVDAESPEGERVVARYGVLAYPTLLVLDARGGETGRVEGYETPEAWLAEVKQARTTDARAGCARGCTEAQRVARLEAALRRDADDPGRAVALAQALLVRGKADVAVPVLEAALARGGPNGIDAGRALGRYYTRARRDGVAGARVFAALVKATAGTPDAIEFRYWEALSLAVAARFDDAAAALDAWVAAEPKSVDALLSRATVLVRMGFPRADAARAVQAALDVDPKAGGAHYLAAELALEHGDRAGAEAAIRRALAIDPTRRTWRNFATRRLGLTLEPAP